MTKLRYLLTWFPSKAKFQEHPTHLYFPTAPCKRHLSVWQQFVTVNSTISQMNREVLLQSQDLVKSKKFPDSHFHESDAEMTALCTSLPIHSRIMLIIVMCNMRRIWQCCILWSHVPMQAEASAPGACAASTPAAHQSAHDSCWPGTAQTPQDLPMLIPLTSANQQLKADW